MASELESKMWLLKSPPLLSLVYSILAMLVPFPLPVLSWLQALSVPSIWNSLATGSRRRSFLRILRFHSNVLLWEDFIQHSVQRMALSLSHLSLSSLCKAFLITYVFSACLELLEGDSIQRATWFLSTATSPIHIRGPDPWLVLNGYLLNE